MKRPTLKQIIIRITAIIALVELAIMIIFANNPYEFNPFVEAILDVIILVSLSTPVIYRLIIKPYVLATEQAENALRTVNSDLETTVKQRTEEYRVAKEEAVHANQAKSEFLSAMSHELRTPMNAILGFSQLLHLDDSLTQTQKSSVQEIISAGDHLMELINEVLDLARIEAGKMKVHPEEYSLNKILSSCLTLIEPLSTERNIVLIDNISTTSNHTIYVDPVRFKQVIINLLSNAIKYNHENNKVNLNCVVMDNNYLRLNVIDQGEGLTSAEIQNLFKSFERFRKDRGIEGTGIGLVITKNLIELMGGEIGVESKVGVGSCFWIKVPLV